MNKHLIRLLRIIRGESQAHMRARIRRAIKQLPRDGIASNWAFHFNRRT